MVESLWTCRRFYASVILFVGGIMWFMYSFHDQLGMKITIKLWWVYVPSCKVGFTWKKDKKAKKVL
jgi:hypothetical protein